MTTRRDPIENLPLSERFRRLRPRANAYGPNADVPLVNRRAHAARAVLSGEGEVPLARRIGIARVVPASLDPFLVMPRDKLTRAYDGAVRQLGLVRQQTSPDTASGPAAPPATFRPLAGAMANNRGAAVKVVVDGPDATAEPFPMVVVETPKNAGEDAEAITVTLGWSFADRDPTNAASDATVVEATARVLFGMGGAIFEAEVDWLQGTTFTIPASYARVSLVDPAIANTQGTNVFVSFGAAYAYGYAVSSPCARKTVVVAAVLTPAMSATDLRVPAFATSMNLSAEPTNTLLRVSFGRVAGTYDTSVFINGLSNLVNLSEQAIPVPNGARFFRVTNLAAFDANNINALFNIAF